MELTIDQALQQGIAAHKEGKAQEAERFYRAILQSQPLHPDANHNLGVLAVSVNKTESALPLFKTALEANPKIEQFWLSYIDALIKAKQFENAKQVFEQAKQQGLAGEKFDALMAQLSPIPPTENANSASPSQSELNSLLEHYQKGRFSDAEKLALSITERFPKHQFGWKVLGALFGQSGRNSESVNANQTAVTLSPQDAGAHNNLGNTLRELGRLKEAEACYTQAIALKPDFAEAHNNLGIMLQELGRLEEAEASYAQAITLKPDFAGAHNNLGNTFKELGRLEEAEASYRQAIALKPDFAEAHNNLGITRQELGKLDEAEQSCRQAIALKPDHAEVHYNLGNTLKELGRLDEAETSYTQAIALKPDYAQAHNNLGNTLKELGRLDEAETSYTQAIALKPDYAQTLENRGLLLLERKDYVSALRDFEHSNSKASRAYALSALYGLGRTKDIYERIESRLEVDEKNLMVAAFSSFFSKVQQKDTAHAFCNNPLDFLYFSNVSSHFDDSDLFITELIEELGNIENIWEPIGHTTRKGFHSKAHINLFDNTSTQIERLKSLIIAELDLYYSKFKNQSCSYIKKWPTGNNLYGWYVLLKEQGYQALHIHPGGWLSGVIYLKVVPALEEHEGAIEFGLSGKHYAHPRSPKVIYEPKLGDIVFFPSSLHHRTIPFTTDTDRIIVSFDLNPN